MWEENKTRKNFDNWTTKENRFAGYLMTFKLTEIVYNVIECEVKKK
jgi:hypothetical protein